MRADLNDLTGVGSEYGAVADTLVSVGDGSVNVSRSDLNSLNKLFDAMSDEQAANVVAHVTGGDSSSFDLIDDMVGYLGVSDPDDVDAVVAAFNDLSVERRELVFDTMGDIDARDASYTLENLVSGPIVTGITASPMVSAADGEVADADAGADGFSISVSFDEAMDTGTTPIITLSDGHDSLVIADGVWSEGDTVYTQAYSVVDQGVDIEGIVVSVSGAADASGNPQLLQQGPVAAVPEAEFNIDTENPTSSTITIEVDDNDQTDGDAATSFTVSTSDLDPGTIHVDMRVVSTPSLPRSSLPTSLRLRLRLPVLRRQRARRRVLRQISLRLRMAGMITSQLRASQIVLPSVMKLFDWRA